MQFIARCVVGDVLEFGNVKIVILECERCVCVECSDCIIYLFISKGVGHYVLSVLGGNLFPSYCTVRCMSLDKGQHNQDVRGMDAMNICTEMYIYKIRKYSLPYTHKKTYS